MRAMKNSLRAGAALIGLSMVLASCGSGVAPDGSGSVRVYDLKTEYKDIQTGAYVACDNAAFPNGSVTQTTNVAVSFALAGTLTSVDVGLRGATITDYDGNYNTNVPANQLADLGSNNFKTVFAADAKQGFLPQNLKTLSIVVNPAVVTIKNVNASNRVSGNGAFFATVSAHTSTGAVATGDTRYSATIPVYSQCNITSDTGATL